MAVSFEEIVREAIRMHSSPSIDRSEAHGNKSGTAYHVSDAYVGFIAHAIQQGMIAAKQVEDAFGGAHPDTMPLLHPHGDIVVCRGCDLSGELEIHPHGHGCELCEEPEILTIEVIKELAALIPRKPIRTGSNPFMNLAADFDLPVDLVYQDAEYTRRLKPGGLGEVRKIEATQDSYVWGRVARAKIVEIFQHRTPSSSSPSYAAYVARLTGLLLIGS